jgi:hypothetical protein
VPGGALVLVVAWWWSVCRGEFGEGGAGAGFVDDGLMPANLPEFTSGLQLNGRFIELYMSEVPGYTDYSPRPFPWEIENPERYGYSGNTVRNSP